MQRFLKNDGSVNRHDCDNPSMDVSMGNVETILNGVQSSKISFMRNFYFVRNFYFITLI